VSLVIYTGIVRTRSYISIDDV